MLNKDKYALICDLAETYNIYDYRQLPLPLVAALACGLGDNSRIKMKMAGTSVPDYIFLLAHAVDRLSILIWQQTKEGQHNRNRPESIVEMLLYGANKKLKKGDIFNSPEDFRNEWNKRIERKR